MKACKITPVSKDRLWGGNKLFAYGKKSDTDRIAESWELSFTDGGVASFDGKLLTEAFPKETWGTLGAKFDRFPVLTKFIDAKENLSVQVHPSDDYALKNENSFGKTEMWLIVEAEPGAGLYMGCNRVVSPDEFRRKIADGTVEEVLNFVPVKAGDVYFIPSGTLHAIGAGVLLYEIQQNSDLTYRVYDYNRRDKDGNLRELHVEKAMKVVDLCPYSYENNDVKDPAVIGTCEYFTTRFYKHNFTKMTFSVDKSSFLMLTVVSGECVIDGQKAVLGDTFFVPAGAGDVEVCGTADVVAVSLS